MGMDKARMSLPFLLFLVCGAVAVAGAILLIAAREPIHSALALILVMVALAVLYLLLGAPFIAAVQVIVYASAIMVLFVFVIMLLNARAEERTDFSQIAKYIGLPLGFVLMLWAAHWLRHSEAGLAIGTAPAAEAASTRALSIQLFRQYLFPFEATSILILIAILGALVLARKEP
jgi:NADH-quinone oxidoreductase subunit J